VLDIRHLKSQEFHFSDTNVIDGYSADSKGGISKKKQA
jgi:hypothetical protein